MSCSRWSQNEKAISIQAPDDLSDHNGCGPVAFVVSLNLLRRHLSESQRAIAAEKLASLEAGQHPHLSGERTSQTLENKGVSNRPIDTSGPSAGAVTQQQASRWLNVGGRSVRRAREILKCADEALLAAVEADEVSVSDASKVVRFPKPIQRLALVAFRAKKTRTLVEALKSIEAEVAALDARGLPIPAAYLPIFAVRDEFAVLSRMADELQAAVDAIISTPAGFYLRKERKNLAEKFREIKYAITRAAPYTVVPGRQTQPEWVSQAVWRTLSDAERQ